jgi:hypothetical protein
MAVSSDINIFSLSKKNDSWQVLFYGTTAINRNEIRKAKNGQDAKWNKQCTGKATIHVAPAEVFLAKISRQIWHGLN